MKDIIDTIKASIVDAETSLVVTKYLHVITQFHLFYQQGGITSADTNCPVSICRYSNTNVCCGNGCTGCQQIIFAPEDVIEVERLVKNSGRRYVKGEDFLIIRRNEERVLVRFYSIARAIQHQALCTA